MRTNICSKAERRGDKGRSGGGARRPWRVWLALACMFAMACAAAAQETGGDVAAQLQRMQSSVQKNGKLQQQFTSDEIWHNVNYGKNGKKTVDESAKYENVFVEGLPYRKKVESNGKPLNGKAAEKEEKRYEKAVEERRGMSIAQKRHWWRMGFTYSLPICCLTTLFDNRIVRHETIGGRDTIVVESTPKPDAKPANDAEKSSLNWKETTWIDTADAMPTRIEVESLTDAGHFAKGMTTRIDFTRLVDSPLPDGQPQQTVWLQQSVVSKFHFKLMWMGVSGETDQTWSNFKRFHVDLRLLEDSVEEVPQGQTQP